MTNNKKLIKTYLVEVIVETNYEKNSLLVKAEGYNSTVKSTGYYFSSKKKALKFYNSILCFESKLNTFTEKKNKSMYEFDSELGVYHEIK